MHQTIEALREGDDVAEFWRSAFAKWRELARNIDQSKVTELAGVIAEAQRDHFEARCGGRSLGQEIMAWSGIAHFYDTEEGSFGDDVERARKIYDAIQLSHVAIDVKVHAERAAITYDLFEGLEDGADDED